MELYDVKPVCLYVLRNILSGSVNEYTYAELTEKPLKNDFTDTELKREIEEALLKNDDILSVESIDISRNRKTLSVNISITSTYGKESAVVNI